MAKRRILAIPSDEELAKMEVEFRRETPSLRPSVAPIAQVAAETALAHDPRTPEQRVEAAKDRAEAEAWRVAQKDGLVLTELALDDIKADALVRDRLALDPEDLEELKSSIARNGLRLPIEVFPLEGATPPWGLLSGYRRLMAMRALALEGGASQIKAIIRDPAAMGGTFAAMVEENEIRANLSHFERGRIAVVAARQGAFASVEAAVDALFPAASKAKRSKIRSFATVFEALGEDLNFAEALREKDGLKLAQTLREEGATRLRAALRTALPQDAQSEWACLEAAMAVVAPAVPSEVRKGGRPARPQGPSLQTASGYRLQAQQDAQGWVIRLGGGQPIDAQGIEDLLREVERLLDTRI